MERVRTSAALLGLLLRRTLSAAHAANTLSDFWERGLGKACENPCDEVGSPRVVNSDMLGHPAGYMIDACMDSGGGTLVGQRM